MEALVLMLMSWIERNSVYEVASMPVPIVVELSPRDLTAEFYKESPHLMPVSGVDQRVLALYAWEPADRGTIYILRSQETEGIQAGENPLENPVFQERLMHELIHHAQYHSGAYERFPCRNFGEKEAYQLGGLYLRKRHATDFLPNRQLLAHMYSRC